MVENPKEFKKAIRGHVAVAISVLLLTGVIVTIGVMGLEPRQTAVLILALAAVQVFLVAQFLMHLAGEEWLIQSVVGFTVFFVAALLALSVYTYHDTYEGTYTTDRPPVTGDVREP